jgi:hypothetical protein
MKEKIRPIYQELQGYLLQIPVPEKPYEVIDSEDVWNRVNLAINELEDLSPHSYGKFKIHPEIRGQTGFVNVTALRVNLGGLIDRLHAEFFSDEPNPFIGGPSTIISQEQSQEQTTNVVMLLDVHEKIVEKLNDEQTNPDERKYLETLKGGLSSAKSALGLINLILSTANTVGIELDKLTQIFK